MYDEINRIIRRRAWIVDHVNSLRSWKLRSSFCELKAILLLTEVVLENDKLLRTVKRTILF